MSDDDKKPPTFHQYGEEGDREMYVTFGTGVHDALLPLLDTMPDIDPDKTLYIGIGHWRMYYFTNALSEAVEGIGQMLPQKGPLKRDAFLYTLDDNGEAHSLEFSPVDHKDDDSVSIAKWATFMMNLGDDRCLAKQVFDTEKFRVKAAMPEGRIEVETAFIGMDVTPWDDEPGIFVTLTTYHMRGKNGTFAIKGYTKEAATMDDASLNHMRIRNQVKRDLTSGRFVVALMNEVLPDVSNLLFDEDEGDDDAV